MKNSFHEQTIVQDDGGSEGWMERGSEGEGEPGEGETRTAQNMICFSIIFGS